MTVKGEDDKTECYICGGALMIRHARMPKADKSLAFQGECDYCVLGKGGYGKREGTGNGNEGTKVSKRNMGDNGLGWGRNVH